MMWIWIALVAAALLAFVFTSMRQYERENTAAVRREVEALQQQVAALVERVQNLEAIAAEEPPVPPVQESSPPNENISVSSRGRTRS